MVSFKPVVAGEGGGQRTVSHTIPPEICMKYNRLLGAIIGGVIGKKGYLFLIINDISVCRCIVFVDYADMARPVVVESIASSFDALLPACTRRTLTHALPA